MRKSRTPSPEENRAERAVGRTWFEPLEREEGSFRHVSLEPDAAVNHVRLGAVMGHHRRPVAGIGKVLREPDRVVVEHVEAHAAA